MHTKYFVQVLSLYALCSKNTSCETSHPARPARPACAENLGNDSDWCDFALLRVETVVGQACPEALLLASRRCNRGTMTYLRPAGFVKQLVAATLDYAQSTNICSFRLHVGCSWERRGKYCTPVVPQPESISDAKCGLCDPPGTGAAAARSSASVDSHGMT